MPSCIAAHSEEPHMSAVNPAREATNTATITSNRCCLRGLCGACAAAARTASRGRSVECDRSTVCVARGMARASPRRVAASTSHTRWFRHTSPSRARFRATCSMNGCGGRTGVRRGERAQVCTVSHVSPVSRPHHTLGKRSPHSASHHTARRSQRSPVPLCLST